MSRALLVVMVAAALAACSTEFDPRAESDLHFSLSGALDASADTQWVRVSPVRESADPSTTSLDATATLLDLATGERWPLRDSLFTFSNGFTANTVWTTAPVAPDAVYRIDVRGPEGDETRATVRTPPDYPTPALNDGPCECPSRVFVSGVDPLVDVIAIYRDPATGEERRFSKRASIEVRPDGRRVARVYFGDDAIAMDRDPLDIRGVEASLLVAAGTADWPDIGIGVDEAALPVASPQVENGVGFVGGTVTKRLPFEPGLGSCPAPGGGTVQPCTAPSR